MREKEQFDKEQIEEERAVEDIESKIIGKVSKTQRGFQIDLLQGELLSDVPDYFFPEKMRPITKLLVPDRTSKVNEGDLVEVLDKTHDTKPDDPTRGVYFVQVRPISKEALERLRKRERLEIPLRKFDGTHFRLSEHLALLDAGGHAVLWGTENEIRQFLSQCKIRTEPEVKSNLLRLHLAQTRPLTPEEITELLETKEVKRMGRGNVGIGKATKIGKLDPEILKNDELAKKYANYFVILRLLNDDYSHPEWMAIFKAEKDLNPVEKSYVEQRRQQIRQEYELHQQALQLAEKVKQVQHEDLSEEDPYQSGYRDTYVIEDPKFRDKKYTYEYFDGDVSTPDKNSIDGRAVLIHIIGDKKVFDYNLLKY